jgi:hypothetical protein
MNQDFSQLDVAIVKAVAAGKRTFNVIVGDRAVHEAAMQFNPPYWRVVDRRIQRLRKMGVMAYVGRDDGWVVSKEALAVSLSVDLQERRREERPHGPRHVAGRRLRDRGRDDLADLADRAEVVRNYVEEHVERVRTAVLKSHTAASIAKWIVEKTTHAFMNYSYHNHEFQERILSDTSRETNVRKCSQIGVSEVSVRKALALVNILNPYTVAYTLPTAKFAGTFVKTRIDPVIEGSKTMMSNVHSTNNNSDVKQFGASFLYIRGAASSNAPISIPCDHLIHDEYDFSDQEVLGQYISR